MTRLSSTPLPTSTTSLPSRNTCALPQSCQRAASQRSAMSKSMAPVSGSGVAVSLEYSRMFFRCFGVSASTPGQTAALLGQ